MPPMKKKTTKKTARMVKKPSAVKAGGFLPREPSSMVVEPKSLITMWFGGPGVGKTTMVNSFGRVLFASTDRGTRMIDAMRVECPDWATFIRLLDELEKPGAVEPYDYLCIDHVGDWSAMAESHVLERNAVESLADLEWGKGWAEYRKTMLMFIARLKALKLGLVFIAHEETKNITINGIKVDRCQPSMPKRAWDIITPITDIIGHCGVQNMKVKGVRKEIRVFDTEPRKDLFAKDRAVGNTADSTMVKIHRVRKPVIAGKTLELLDGKKFMETFRRA